MEARREFWPQIHKARVFSATHCIGEWISVFIRRKPSEAAEELGLQTSRSSQRRPSGKGRSSSGTWHPWNALPSHPKSLNIPRNAAVLIQPGIRGLVGPAQCHHITLCASGKVEKDKKFCCHLNSPVSPPVIGSEGWEMPERGSRTRYTRKGPGSAPFGE